MLIHFHISRIYAGSAISIVCTNACIFIADTPQISMHNFIYLEFQLNLVFRLRLYFCYYTSELIASSTLFRAVFIPPFSFIDDECQSEKTDDFFFLRSQSFVIVIAVEMTDYSPVELSFVEVVRHPAKPGSMNPPNEPSAVVSLPYGSCSRIAQLVDAFPWHRFFPLFFSLSHKRTIL